MRWLFGMLLAAGIVAAAIVPAWQDRAVVSGRVTLATCAEDLGEGTGESSSLTWRLRLGGEPHQALLDLSDEQLIALGFDRHAVTLLGAPRATGQELPTPRPAWLQLRADSAPGGRLVVTRVAATRAGLSADANSIVVRARLGFVAYGPPDLARVDSAGRPAPGRPQTAVHVEVLELIPPLLHLTPQQDAQLRAVRAGSECRTSPASIVIAMGRHGSLWVERLLSR